MKKKVLSLVLGTAMVASVLAGCGNSSTTTEAPAETKEETTTAAATTEESAAPAETASEDEPVTITLGIWPEDTMTDDICCT